MARKVQSLSIEYPLEISLGVAPAVPGSTVTDLRHVGASSADPILDADSRDALDIVARRCGPALDDSETTHAPAVARTRGSR